MRYLGLALSIAAAGLAPRADVSGVVFVDQNGNGRRDAGEPGLPGASVSDQVQVVSTAADGTFRMAGVSGSAIVFVSVPDGYRVEGKFWRTVGDGASALEFPLVRGAASRDFVFIHASDTHLSPASVDRIRRVKAIVDSVKPAFVLITGDLVRDALRVGEAEATGYFELFMQESGAFSAPVWTAPGNHDVFGIERMTSLVSAKHPLYGRAMYHHFLGPDYYSFNYSGVHFVALNTVDIADLWYYGHVDSTQAEWLRRDLAAVPANVPVVTFNHIPFFTSIETVNGYMADGPAPTAITVNGKTSFRHSVSNAGDVIAILQSHPYTLALGGHMHVRELLRYEGSPIRFFQAAAVIGPSEGSGLALRSGVTVYRVTAGKIDDGTFVPLDP